MKGEAWQGLIQKRIAQHFRQFHTHRDEGVGRRSFLRSTAGAAGLAFTSGLVADLYVPAFTRGQSTRMILEI